jgi:hypothetical protein
MRKQHTLLAGVAALALFAASGIASAQQTQQDQKGAGSAAQNQRSEQGAKNQSANQGMKNQGAQQGKNQNAQNAMSKQSSGQNAQNEKKMQSGQGNAGKMSNAGKGEKSFNRSAQEQKQNKGAGLTNRTAQGQQKQLNAQTKTTQSKNGQFATQQGNKTQRGASTAQRNEQLKGLQGSTRAPMQGSTEQRNGGAANVSLNEQQRTQIRQTVINSRSAPRVSNVDFSVNVGTVVPRGHIHLVRVPETLIRIQPRWRHYLYFVYNDEIVIVDPRSMRIIDVLPV